MMSDEIKRIKELNVIIMGNKVVEGNNYLSSGIELIGLILWKDLEELGQCAEGGREMGQQKTHMHNQ